MEQKISVTFEVFTAVTMKNGVFWVVTPCGSCKNPEDIIIQQNITIALIRAGAEVG
jgi:hypothetical protein